MRPFKAPKGPHKALKDPLRAFEAYVKGPGEGGQVSQGVSALEFSLKSHSSNVKFARDPRQQEGWSEMKPKGRRLNRSYHFLRKLYRGPPPFLEALQGLVRPLKAL